jgi:hypothetical protein
MLHLPERGMAKNKPTVPENPSLVKGEGFL